MAAKYTIILSDNRSIQLSGIEVDPILERQLVRSDGAYVSTMWVLKDVNDVTVAKFDSSKVIGWVINEYEIVRDKLDG